MATKTKTVMEWTCDGCGHEEALTLGAVRDASDTTAPKGWREITLGEPGSNISMTRHLCDHCAAFVGHVLDGSFEARVTGEKHLAWCEGQIALDHAENPYAPWTEAEEE